MPLYIESIEKVGNLPTQQKGRSGAQGAGKLSCKVEPLLYHL